MGLLRLIFKPVGCLLYAVGALAIALVLGLVALVWALNHYAVPLVKYTLESQTGYSIACESAQPNLWLGDFEATGIRVFNPAAFGEPSFIECDRVFIDADPLSALVSKTFLIHEVTVEIARLHIVFNRFGENNLSAFLEACAPEKKPEEAPAPTVAVPTAKTPAALPATAEETLPPRWQEVPAQTAKPPSPAPPAWRIAKLRIVVKQVRVQLGTDAAMDWSFNYDRTFYQVTNLDVFLEQLRADLLRRALSPGGVGAGAGGANAR